MIALDPVVGELSGVVEHFWEEVIGVPPFCEAGVVVRFYATAEAA